MTPSHLQDGAFFTPHFLVYIISPAHIFLLYKINKSPTIISIYFFNICKNIVFLVIICYNYDIKGIKIMNSFELCIDMGSGYTTIYKKNVGVVLREPTLALMETSGKNLKLLKSGLEAERLYGKASDNEVFVRPIVDGVIKNLDLAQRLLSHFLSKIVKYRFVKPAIKLIALLPLGLEDEDYDNYRKLFYSVGFARIDFVFGVSSASFIDFPLLGISKTNLIVNMGAGKSEMAVVVNGKIVNGCSINVGGSLIDRCIVDYLQHTKGYIISTHTASKLKQEIGSLYESDNSSMEVVVQDSSGGGSMNTVISAQDIFKPICENYFKILQTIKAFLNSCSQDIAQDIVHQGIILIGGASNIDGLEKFFKKVLDMPVLVMENAEIVSVMGSEKLFCDYNLLQKVVEEN